MFDALRRWIADECRLLALESWSDGRYHGPPCPAPLTASDPRCQRTIERLAQVGDSMKRMRSRVLDGRQVTCSASTDVRSTIARAGAWSGQRQEEADRDAR